LRYLNLDGFKVVNLLFVPPEPGRSALIYVIT
jgi:hypothetical protein